MKSKPIQPRADQVPMTNAQAKRAMEALARIWADEHGLELTSVTVTERSKEATA